MGQLLKVTTYLQDDVCGSVRSLADVEARSFADMLRILIKEGLAARKLTDGGFAMKRGRL